MFVFQIGESFVYEEEIQILLRNCILNGLPILSVIKEYLHMSDIQSSVVCIDCLKNYIQHIDREHLTQIQVHVNSQFETHPTEFTCFFNTNKRSLNLHGQRSLKVYPIVSFYQYLMVTFHSRL